MYIIILRHFSDAVRRKRREEWRINSWFLFHENAPAYRSVLAKDFLANNNVITLGVPHTLLATHQLIFTCSLDCNQDWLDGSLVMLLTYYLRMRWKYLKGFHKMAPRNVSNTLSLAEIYSCTREIFWRKCSLNDCNVLYFSEIKWFQEHFDATM